jgi:phosphoglycolate phosphatase
MDVQGPPQETWEIEVVREGLRLGHFRAGLFDFDGTISLIREGWQNVMVPYFTSVLLAAPRAGDEEQVKHLVTEFVDELTGKQTIYQCIRLAEEVERAGGVALPPLEYKQEYHERLMRRIRHRITGLKSGAISPADMVVPGSVEFLKALRDRGLTLYLASGTDEKYVLDEAASLGVSQFFNGGIYGALDEYKLFSKAMVIQRILREHQLAGHELLGLGDGFVEIENVKEVGGVAIGVASDEVHRQGINSWKRQRLLQAGADVIIPDFARLDLLMTFLFPCTS